MSQEEDSFIEEINLVIIDEASDHTYEVSDGTTRRKMHFEANAQSQMKRISLGDTFRLVHPMNAFFRTG